MSQNEQNNNKQTEQLTDLPVNDEQAEQAKGGSDAMKYNFGAIETPTSEPRVGQAGAGMQDTEKGVTGMFA